MDTSKTNASKMAATVPALTTAPVLALVPAPAPTGPADPLTAGAQPIVRDVAPTKAPRLNLEDASNYTKRIFLTDKGKTNPKRPGSQAATDYLHYRPGMTVLAYLQDERMPRRRARANIQWDLDHGFIVLQDVVKGATETGVNPPAVTA